MSAETPQEQVDRLRATAEGYEAAAAALYGVAAAHPTVAKALHGVADGYSMTARNNRTL